MMSVLIDCGFVVDAFTFRFITGGVVDFFPTWITIMLGVGLMLTVIGSALMKYAIESKKLDPSDTLFNLFFRVVHEVLIFTIFFSLFASQIS